MQVLSGAMGVLTDARRHASAGWTPAQLASLQLWTEARRVTGVTEGAILPSWTDLSGRSNAMAIGGGKEPTWYGATGGVPRVVFSGVRGLMAASAFSGNQPRTVAVAYKPLDLTITNELAGSASTFVTNTWFMLQSRTGGATGDPYLAKFSSDIAGPAPTSTPKVAIATFDGSVSTLYNSNTTIGTSTAALNTNSCPFYIGSPNLGESVNVEIYACVCTNACVSGTDLTNLVAYMGAMT